MKQLLPRSKRLLPKSLSTIKAGYPTAVVGEEYRFIDVNSLVTKDREGYVLYEVDGDSMPHIPHRSLVFVDTWAEPRNGSIIAAEVDGRICVKEFRYSTTGLRLVSANEAYQPRHITKDSNFRVLGVVKAHLVLH